MGNLVSFAGTAVILGIMVYVSVMLIRLWLLSFRTDIERRIDYLAGKFPKLTPDQFWELRSRTKKNFPGIYILYNKSKRMYYVGQAVKVFDRVNRHFTGKGNGDVYADYKYGDKFIIRMIPLRKSGFKNLNDLERHAIARYRAYEKGYNKTRGNKT